MAAYVTEMLQIDMARDHAAPGQLVRIVRGAKQIDQRPEHGGIRLQFVRPASNSGL